MKRHVANPFVKFVWKEFSVAEFSIMFGLTNKQTQRKELLSCLILEQASSSKMSESNATALLFFLHELNYVKINDGRLECTELCGMALSLLVHLLKRGIENEVSVILGLKGGNTEIISKDSRLQELLLRLDFTTRSIWNLSAPAYNLGPELLNLVVMGINNYVELDLSFANTDDTDIEAICAGLKTLTRLEKLRYDLVLEGKQAIILASCLQFLPGLVELNIGDMRADDTGIKAICDGLKTATRLEKLNMYKCIRSNEQARIFASCLEFLSRLVELNIGGLLLRSRRLETDTGVKAICDGLKTATGLKKLTMHYSIHSNEQAIMLASCLQSMPKLNHISIASDDLQQESGVKAIVKALKRVTSLTHLYLVEWRPKSRHKWIFEIMQEEGFQTNKIRTMDWVGAVVTWGDKRSGGDKRSVQTALRGVDKIYSTYGAFAAVLQDGTVVTWGDKRSGGDSSSVQTALRGVDKIYSTGHAFAAVLQDGMVVTWGHKDY